MREAFAVAQDSRPGPVLIDLPKDVQAEVTEFNYPSSPASPNGARRAASSELKRAARLLDEAERPVIIVGHGVHLSGAWGQVCSLGTVIVHYVYIPWYFYRRRNAT